MALPRPSVLPHVSRICGSVYGMRPPCRWFRLKSVIKELRPGSPCMVVYCSAAETSMAVPRPMESGDNFGIETWMGEASVSVSETGVWLVKEKRGSSEGVLAGESEWNSAAMCGTKRAGLAAEASSVSNGKYPGYGRPVGH